MAEKKNQDSKQAQKKGEDRLTIVPTVDPNKLKPGKTGVCIVGFASSSKDLIPWDREEWEFWGENAHMGLQKADRWFDMHKREVIDNHPNEVYLPWLQRQSMPVYMQEPHKDIPGSVRYPLGRMIKRFSPYFTNSIAYMLALAIDMLTPLAVKANAAMMNGKQPEAIPEIGLYGVDMLLESEYQYQRPCCEYFVGIAMGLGIKVHLPVPSALLKSNHFYGYQDPPKDQGITQDLLRDQATKLAMEKQKLEKQANQIMQQLAGLGGALNQVQFFHEHSKNFDRGGSSLHKELRIPLPKQLLDDPDWSQGKLGGQGEEGAA